MVVVVLLVVPLPSLLRWCPRCPRGGGGVGGAPAVVAVVVVVLPSPLGWSPRCRCGGGYKCAGGGGVVSIDSKF